VVGGTTDGPFARPDEVDPAYVDTVLNELFRIFSEVESDLRDQIAWTDHPA
jgi:hypothetical protein